MVRIHVRSQTHRQSEETSRHETHVRRSALQNKLKHTTRRALSESKRILDSCTLARQRTGVPHHRRRQTNEAPIWKGSIRRRGDNNVIIS